MLEKTIKVNKSNFNKYIVGRPMVGKFREYFDANAKTVVINDIYGICNRRNIIDEITGTVITISDIDYNNDDIKITRVTGETHDQHDFYFDLVISGVYKNKDFSFRTDSISLHNLIFNGIENEDKIEYNKYLHNHDKIIKTTKMPTSMKKYLYNTFTTRMVLFIINEIFKNFAYEINA